ncbi:MAG: hypothetical protein ACKPE6_16715, partial [Gammaproteobacteria bacterium]
LVDHVVSDKAKGRDLLALWIRHLAGCAAGVLQGPSRLHDASRTHALPLLQPLRARELLSELVALREDGLSRALPFLPEASWVFSESSDPDAARIAFLGSDFSRGDSDDPYLARVFGEWEDVPGEDFRELSLRVFAPLHRCLGGEPP